MKDMLHPVDDYRTFRFLGEVYDPLNPKKIWPLIRQQQLKRRRESHCGHWLFQHQAICPNIRPMAIDVMGMIDTVMRVNGMVYVMSSPVIGLGIQPFLHFETFGPGTPERGIE